MVAPVLCRLPGRQLTTRLTRSSCALGITVPCRRSRSQFQKLKAVRSHGFVYVYLMRMLPTLKLPFTTLKYRTYEFVELSTVKETFLV